MACDYQPSIIMHCLRQPAHGLWATANAGAAGGLREIAWHAQRARARHGGAHLDAHRVAYPVAVHDVRARDVHEAASKGPHHLRHRRTVRLALG
eukprot:21846-Prymnesium_polylepis.1